MGDLAAVISAVLPPGYLVDNEQSLQIREIELNDTLRVLRPKPDLAIYAASTPLVTATFTLPVLATMYIDPEDLYFSAVVIYKSTSKNAKSRCKAACVWLKSTISTKPNLY